MRTTLTLDDDVSNLLAKEIKRSGEPMKQAVNRLLRSGLKQAAAPAKPKPFRIKTRKLGLPAAWTSGSIPELIEMLEGPLHR